MNYFSKISSKSFRKPTNILSTENIWLRNFHQKYSKCDETLLNFWNWSGAKNTRLEAYSTRRFSRLEDLEKCSKMSIYNLLAKIGVNTAENEPDVEVWSNGLLVLLMVSPVDASPTLVDVEQAVREIVVRLMRLVVHLGNLYAESGQT